jgi:hypothetical protein
LLKLLSSSADDDDMEPLDLRARRAIPPPPAGSGAPLAPITTRMATVPSPSAQPPVAPAPTPPGASWAQVAPSPATRVISPPRPALKLRPMAPWRIVGALMLAATFGLMGWQVQRLVDDQPWSDALMWTSVLTGAVASVCVLGWTWIATDNARRLVEPANRANLPDPAAAVRSWIVPFVFVAVAVGFVILLGERTGTASDGAGETKMSVVPLAVAVLTLLLAIPMTYRPMHHLAGVVRQVGGYSVRVAQWMWVPVVMALVGVASIVALRFAGVDDADDAATGADGWVPLWVVAVVAIAPCVITVLLAWRAASSVEDAITVAAARRRVGGAPSSTRIRRASPSGSRRRVAATERIELLAGTEVFRLVMVTLVAGLALLSLVGAIVTGLLWMDSRDTGVLPAERQRTWDALDALRAASTGVIAALLVTVVAWTLLTVINVRRTSGRRFNPLLAALSWPAAAGAVWWIADAMIVDATIGSVVLGFAAQAAVFAVPFLIIERGADAVGARRTPLRIVYVLGVVLLVHVQGLGGLLRLPDAATTTTQIGRLAGYLAIGALIQLCSTLAITEACHAISRTCRHEADHHNMLVEARRSAAHGAARPPAEVARP